MRPSPTVILIAALAVALLLVTVLFARPDASGLPPLSVRSTEPNGGRALSLWLEALGFRVEEIDAEPYAIDPTVPALFILAPTTRFDDAAVDAVAAWVEAGGLLVLVSTGGPRPLLERFGFRVRFAGDRQAEAVTVQPLLGQPLVERARVDAWETVEGGDGLAPWLAAGDRVVLGSRPYGQGRVVVLTSVFPLSNQGLAQSESASLALNLVGGLPAGARLTFD